MHSWFDSVKYWYAMYPEIAVSLLAGPLICVASKSRVPSRHWLPLLVGLDANESFLKIQAKRSP